MDACQGSEFDYVLISCVRSNWDGRIGFVKDPKRINVAISRAKQQLVLTGNSQTMGSDEDWRYVISQCTRGTGLAGPAVTPNLAHAGPSIMDAEREAKAEARQAAAAAGPEGAAGGGRAGAAGGDGCFNCGSSDHWSRECPALGGAGGKADGKGGKGKGKGGKGKGKGKGGGRPAGAATALGNLHSWEEQQQLVQAFEQKRAAQKEWQPPPPAQGLDRSQFPSLGQVYEPFPAFGTPAARDGAKDRKKEKRVNNNPSQKEWDRQRQQALRESKGQWEDTEQAHLPTPAPDATPRRHPTPAPSFLPHHALLPSPPLASCHEPAGDPGDAGVDVEGGHWCVGGLARGGARRQAAAAPAGAGVGGLARASLGSTCGWARPGCRGPAAGRPHGGVPVRNVPYARDGACPAREIRRRCAAGI